MSFWAILKNLGLVISFFKSFKSLISEVAQSKKAPSAQSVRDLLESAQKLLRSGAIDIPNVDENQIADAIKVLEEQLSGN